MLGIQKFKIWIKMDNWVTIIDFKWEFRALTVFERFNKKCLQAFSVFVTSMNGLEMNNIIVVGFYKWMNVVFWGCFAGSVASV